MTAMKNLKFKAITFILICFVCFIQSSAIGAEKFSRNISREYSVDEASLLGIHNKFGDIIVNTWAQNEAKVEVTITVLARDESEAEKRFDYINIEFIEDGNTFQVVTHIDEDINSRHFVKDDDEEEFRIDYQLFIPIYLKMNLSNKYGNIHIGEIHGKSNISLGYGKLIADKLLFDETKPLSTISIKYGKASVSTISRLKIESSYSEINIQKSAALIVSSKYSEVNIHENRALVVDSKYDAYEIDQTRSMVIIGKYGDYKIGKVEKKLDIDTKYTNIIVSEMNPEFSEIEIVNSYGNVEIEIPDSASYTINAIGKNCNVSYPKSNNLSVVKSEGEFQINGSIGEPSEKSGKVTINTKYGNVEL